MKKQLPTDEIANELTGASAFFPKRSLPSEVKPATQLVHTVQPTHQPQSTQQPEEINATKQAQQEPTDATQPQVAQTNRLTASNHATTPPHNQGGSTSNGLATVPSRHHDPTPPSVLEQIRKVVKQVGKEAATYRLTPAEKEQLADIVYTYKRRGYRTSDNELARIAINWLILGYHEEGEQSVLARVLARLHE